MIRTATPSVIRRATSNALLRVSAPSRRSVRPMATAVAAGKTFKTKGGFGGLSIDQVIVFPWVGKGPSSFGPRDTAEVVAANWDGKGKTIIITGAAGGLGNEAARVLGSHGAEIIVTARSMEKAMAAAEKLKKVAPAGTYTPMALDIGSFKSIRAFADDYMKTGKPIHTLMNSAGVMATDFMRTEDGHEYQFGTNFLGSFLLSMLLLPKLKETAKATGTQARIISTSSTAHHFPYEGGIRPEAEINSEEGYAKWNSYGQSKVALLLFSRLLSEQMAAEGSDVAAVTLHPGFIAETGLARHMPEWMDKVYRATSGPFVKNTAEGASSQVYLTVAPKIVPGEHYMDNNIYASSEISHNRELAQRVMDYGMKVTGLST